MDAGHREGCGGPEHAVTVLLGGMGTSLSPAEASVGRLGPFWDPDRLVPYLRDRGLQASDIVFSYRGATLDDAGEVRPIPYAAADTFRRSVADGVARLADQLALHLAAHPGSRVCLIGHSFGGVVAFGYLARLAQAGVWTLPGGGRLTAVITLDAPLGGVFGAAPFQLAVGKAYLALLHRQWLLRNFDDLVRLWRTAAGREPFGANARVAAIVGDSRRRPTNQQVAHVAREHGVRVLTVGSRDDRCFDPGMRVPPYPSVQWITDAGPGSGIYGRVTDSDGAHGRLPDIVGTHGAVLHDTRVLEAIWHFLTGGDPCPLEPAPAQVFSHVTVRPGAVAAIRREPAALSGNQGAAGGGRVSPTGGG